MTQEEKELLLLKDLCSRLPYRVKCDIGDNKSYTLNSISDDYDDGTLLRFKEQKNGLNVEVYLSECKPYLFPLSSMTEDQCYELSSIRSSFQDCWKYIKTPIPLSICNFEQIDFFNKNHLDYNGLIEKGLAIDATSLNIY